MIKMARFWLASSLVVLLAGVSAGQESPPLAVKAQAILKEHCYRCHGEDGANEGGFNYVLLRNKLVAGGKYVVPGRPDQSLVHKRLAGGTMPPEGEPRPDAKDVEVIAEWIRAGAPDGGAPVAERRRIRLGEILRLIRADLEKASERDRKYLRYFTITHLHNAGFSEDELQSYRHGLSKLVNSLSWGRNIVIPRPIDPARTLLRIDLRDYQWTEKTWNDILTRYPYGVVPESEDAKACCDSTRSRLPLVRADWFVAAASVPPLYESILNLPSTDRELEQQLRVPVAENIRQERVARAGFNGSGISQHNRLIERHESIFGSYWKSYDFGNSSGRANLFAHPFGPGREANTFRHDGGEIIFSLPNGLQAFMIIDGAGERISKAPTAIVSDARRPDRAVVNGLSCMSCHTQGILPKDDQVREFVKTNPKAFTDSERETIEALYPTREEFTKLQRQDSERYRDALAKTGGRIGRTEPILALAQRFEAPLEPELAAAEVDLTAGLLVTTLDGSPKLARIMGTLKVRGGTMQRQAFTESFRSIALELKLGIVLGHSAAPADVPGVGSTPRSPTDPAGPAHTIKLGATLSDLILSRDREWLYLLDISSGQVRRLSTRSFEIDETAAKLTAGTEQMRMSPDGRMLYTCAAPNGHDYFNANKGGKFQVIDPETLTVRSTITVPFSPWDMAVDDQGLLYVTIGGGQSTFLPVIDSKKKVVVTEWKKHIWHRNVVRITPDQKKLYLAVTDLSPLSMQGMPLDGDLTPGRETHSQSGGGGKFQILPDGKALILASGEVKRISPNPEGDLKGLAAIAAHICLAADKGSDRLFVALKDKTVKVYSYPDFEPIGSIPVGQLVYRMAYDDKSGMLYCATSPKELTGRLALGIGDLQVFDVTKYLEK